MKSFIALLFGIFSSILLFLSGALDASEKIKKHCEAPFIWTPSLICYYFRSPPEIDREKESQDKPPPQNSQPKQNGKDTISTQDDMKVRGILTSLRLGDSISPCGIGQYKLEQSRLFSFRLISENKFHERQQIDLPIGYDILLSSKCRLRAEKVDDDGISKVLLVQEIYN